MTAPALRTTATLAALGLLAACGSVGSDAGRQPRPRRGRATTTTTSTTTTIAAPTTPSTTTTRPPTPPMTASAPPFVFTVSGITPALAQRMTPTSWRPGCPVPLEDLRYLHIGYWGFDGRVHEGEMVVHRDAVGAIQGAFSRLFAMRFPIRSMRLVDDFGGDDTASVEADNTSAFNCRAATGSTSWSRHAYGRAVDLDPIENPYVSNGTTEHAASVPYLDRRNARPGMAVAGGPVVAAFAAQGWGWGGSWSSPKDYQHFSADGH